MAEGDMHQNLDQAERRNRWKLDDGRTIYLLTPERFAALADGTAVVCIDGETRIKGTDPIDDDTRFGHLAYGLLPES